MAKNNNTTINKEMVDMLLKKAYNHYPQFMGDRIDYEHSFWACSVRDYPIGGFHMSSKGVEAYEILQSETDEEGNWSETDNVVERYRFTRKQRAEVARIIRFWKRRYAIIERVPEKRLFQLWNLCQLKGERQREFARQNALVMVERNHDEDFLDYLKRVVVANHAAV